MALALCPSCARHVRTAESTCPFCAASLDPSDVREWTLPMGATRAQVFLGALTLAAATAGCNKTELGQSGTHTASSEPTQAIAAPYGVPITPFDAALVPVLPPADAGQKSDAASHPRAAAPIYGLPPK